jgi:hypothetical protein
MHEHDSAHDVETGVVRKPARVDGPDDGRLWQAAAAGRAEAVGREGLLRLQRTVGNAGAASVAEERSPVLDVVSSGGRPLEEPVRADMEQRLGHDFRDVKVHDDGAAHESAKAVNAHAYTVGSHVVFQRDTYDPGSHAGRTMLAHELTHVVQQRSGPVSGTPMGNGVKVSDPSDSFEREAAATADRVMSAPSPVQRDEAGDEEEVQGAFVHGASEQGAFVQRDEAGDEEEAQG